MQQTSYDRILYPSFARTSTHPDRLATLGRLFGMNVAPIETSRILEIGCGDGGNLIPIARGLPESRCVGFDLSSRAIESGQKVIDHLGLENCGLRYMDIVHSQINRYNGYRDVAKTGGFREVVIDRSQINRQFSIIGSMREVQMQKKPKTGAS